MKRNIFILTSALALCSNAATVLTFSRTDGSLWTTQIPMVGDAVETSPCCYHVGGQTNYGAYSYSIDGISSSLLRDGHFVGNLYWPEGGFVVQMPSHLGFAIDSFGQGWILAQESDSGGVAFAWKVDLSSGTVSLEGYAGPAYGGQFPEVDGLVTLTVLED